MSNGGEVEAKRQLVAFRVDASAHIGLGHLKRCASLAETLRAAGFATQLVTKNLGFPLRPEITDQFDRISLLPPPVTAGSEPDPPLRQGEQPEPAEDAERFLSAVDRAPAWVAVDHYGLDRRWIDLVRAATGARQLAIDDLGDRPLTADLLIDHNLEADHREKHRISGPPSCLLGGPRYALIARIYGRARRHLVTDEVRSIGICMGGADPLNATEKAWLACRTAGFKGKVEIVTTSANPNLSRLRKIAATDGQTRLTLDLPHLTEFFAIHDIQIGAAGGATWERCCVGAPSIVVQTAPNQAVPLAGLGLSEAALTCEGVEADEIADRLRELLADSQLRDLLGRRSRALVDGRGCERVTARMADAVDLRAAKESDADWVFAWRNHPDTRRHIIDPRELDLGEHIEWWHRAIAAPDRLLTIAQVGTIPVGVLRLDRTGDEAEVSLYTDPALSGLGLGPKMIRAAEGLRFKSDRVRRLTARILEPNRASLRAFKKAGYRQAGERWIRELDS